MLSTEAIDCNHHGIVSGRGRFSARLIGAVEERHERSAVVLWCLSALHLCVCCRVLLFLVLFAADV